MNNDPRDKEIARLYSSGWFTMDELGQMFGLSKATISRAVADQADTFSQTTAARIEQREEEKQTTVVLMPQDEFNRVVAEAITTYMKENKYDSRIKLD